MFSNKLEEINPLYTIHPTPCPPSTNLSKLTWPPFTHLSKVLLGDPLCPLLAKGEGTARIGDISTLNQNLLHNHPVLAVGYTIQVGGRTTLFTKQIVKLGKVLKVLCHVGSQDQLNDGFSHAAICSPRERARQNEQSLLSEGSYQAYVSKFWKMLTSLLCSVSLKQKATWWFSNTALQGRGERGRM